MASLERYVGLNQTWLEAFGPIASSQVWFNPKWGINPFVPISKMPPFWQAIVIFLKMTSHEPFVGLNGNLAGGIRETWLFRNVKMVQMAS